MPAIAASAPDYAGYAYAALLALGGIAGGLRKGSLISAVAGAGSGVAAAYGASRVSKNSFDAYPSLIVSSLLLALMSWRLFKTGKFMPAGLVVLLSLVMTVRYYTFLA
ncbi:hypothetical protein B9479_002984 [Cryptococcus floricola]|uniref:Transmembrane protein 14C n=1 Tax=Cryptococcus floricola TaxID=2591691 RepID=A0A5D3B0P4_9TREE|nr:hypothetical protein B9479_002984 [Cryptococcus floricola]